MLTAGEILKAKRLERGLTYQDIEKKIKIRQKYLKALEEDNLDMFQGKTYVRGFVKNYSEYLGLPTEELLAILRRQYDEKQKKELLPKGLSNPINKNFLFGRKISIPLTFLIGIVLLSIYVIYQFQLLGGEPYLQIDNPKDKLVTKDNILIVKGKTDRENKIILNGQEINLSEDGSFSQELNLQKGENIITIIATNKMGREKKIEKTVIKNL